MMLKRRLASALKALRRVFAGGDCPDREGAGDGIRIFGCNTMSRLSAGLFELCRTEDDTSGRNRARTRKMGVNTLAFRLPQHGRFYAVDADCVGLNRDSPGTMVSLIVTSACPRCSR